MPKRSTRIQNLIELIELDKSSSFSVFGSKMLRDKDSGYDREVDIVLEGEVNAHKFIISIEVIEQSRPAGQPWVEQMSGKHESLPTHKLVLVSNSGFSKPALIKARSLNIDVYDLRTQKKDFKDKVESIATIERLEVMLGLFVNDEIVMPEDDFKLGSTTINAGNFLREFAEFDVIQDELFSSSENIIVKVISDNPEMEGDNKIIFVARMVDKTKNDVDISVVNYQGTDYLYGSKKSDIKNLFIKKFD